MIKIKIKKACCMKESDEFIPLDRDRERLIKILDKHMKGKTQPGFIRKQVSLWPDEKVREILDQIGGLFSENI